MKTANALKSADILSASEMQRVRNVDRMLPSQPVMRKLFNGDDEAFHSGLESLLLSVLPSTGVEEKWDLELKPGVTYASLGSDICTLHFYQLLICLGGIRRVLELGTYIGVSALYLAEAVGSQGRVTTVELGEEFHAIAQRNFARNGLSGRIRAVLGSALDVLRLQVAQSEHYDMILMDAAKEAYASMFEPALHCLAPGGLLVVDDIFMNGDSLNAEPDSEKGCGIRQLLTKASALPADYNRVILPMGNGTLLIRKPN